MDKPRNIINALECYIKKDDKYLMLHRNKNKRIMPGIWMAPGGKREFNEGLFESARREVMEETGLSIKNLRVIGTGCAFLKDLNQELFFTFVGADYAGGELIENSPEGEFRWVTQEEMLKLDGLLPELLHVSPLFLKDDGPIVSWKAVYDGTKMTEFEIEDSK